MASCIRAVDMTRRTLSEHFRSLLVEGSGRVSETKTLPLNSSGGHGLSRLGIADSCLGMCSPQSSSWSDLFNQRLDHSIERIGCTDYPTARSNCCGNMDSITDQSARRLMNHRYYRWRCGIRRFGQRLVRSAGPQTGTGSINGLVAR
jgi:hypothetical protein